MKKRGIHIAICIGMSVALSHVAGQSMQEGMKIIDYKIIGIPGRLDVTFIKHLKEL